jgi:Rieske Fe-S protein
MCGNDYDKTMEITHQGRRHVFDSFECAIHAIAPICEHCGCKVVGHGIEVDGQFFCCAHCAREKTGLKEVRDRVDAATF